MDRSKLSECAKAIYAERLRHLVETEENIGKMLIIEVASRDYEIDEVGIESAHKLQAVPEQGTAMNYSPPQAEWGVSPSGNVGRF
jgi:hypothetical protein